MFLLSDLDFSLPLKNPVVIFSLVLFIILFAPLILNRFRIPHIIGLIIAGVIIGPYGANLLLRDSSIVLFGTVGLQYIMFTAGLEIDLEEFRRSRFKSLVFGLFTFIISMSMGTAAGYYLLSFSLPSSLLLGGMFASHTLLAYPITSKYGINRIRSVTMAIGGTIITDILALLSLAAVTGMTRGEISTGFWIKLAISTIIFGVIVFVVFPLLARWFLKTIDDHVSQYIFVLAMVFLGAFLAEVAGLEAIIGAFLSGLALNKFIPHSSALMNRIEFVGNAFFIPFFLISVGMLVDFSVLFKGWGAIKVAGVMTVLGILAKFIAAFLTQKSFRLSILERQMLFGLSTARVGATLAVVLVGYNIIIGETVEGEPIRLLNEDVLNGTILMILVTCTVSSFIVEKASRKLALAEENVDVQKTDEEKILISLAYPETVTELVDLALMLKPGKSNIPVYALHIVSEETAEETAIKGKKMMEKAMNQAASSGKSISPLTRFDINISNGIIYTIKEQKITDVLIGLHHGSEQKDFLGHTTESILRKISETIYIYKPVQPFNTLRRMVVVAPPKAHLEPGFFHWYLKLNTIAKEAGIAISFFGHDATNRELLELKSRSSNPAKMEFHQFNKWDDFLIFSRELKPDDIFVIISSRKGHVSYVNQLEKLSHYLPNYFNKNSFILVYPRQVEYGLQMEDVQYVDGSIIETIADGGATAVNRAGGFFRNIFRKKKV